MKIHLVFCIFIALLISTVRAKEKCDFQEINSCLDHTECGWCLNQTTDIDGNCVKIYPCSSNKWINQNCQNGYLLIGKKLDSCDKPSGSSSGVFRGIISGIFVGLILSCLIIVVILIVRKMTKKERPSYDNSIWGNNEPMSE